MKTRPLCCKGTLSFQHSIDCSREWVLFGTKIGADAELGPDLKQGLETQCSVLELSLPCARPASSMLWAIAGLTSCTNAAAAMHAHAR